MRRADCEVPIVPNMDDIEDLQEISAEELLEIVREGGEIAVESSEVAQKLEACGFEIKYQNQDGSQYILQGKGEINTGCRKGEVLPLSHPVQVPIEIDEEEPDFRAGPVVNGLPQPVALPQKDFWIDSPYTDPTFQRNVAASEPQIVHAHVEFKRAYTRPTESCEEVQVHLMLDCATFGVEKCVRRIDCLGHFVYQLEIIASPREAWKSSCTLSRVRPGEVSQSTQRGQARELQLTFNTSGAVPGAQVSGTTGTSTGSSGNSFGWLPAKFQRPRPNQDDKSVTWTWQMKTWSDGQKFDADRTWVLIRTLPELPITDPENVNLIDLAYENDATWTIPETAAEGLHNKFEWDIRVRIHTTVVRPYLRVRVLRQLVLVRGKSEKCAPCEFYS